MKLQISWEDTTLESETPWQDLRVDPGLTIIGETVTDFEAKTGITIDAGGDDEVFELDVADHDYDSDEELEKAVTPLLDDLEKKLKAAGLALS